MAVKKERLDVLVQRHLPHLSKTVVQSLIMQGKVSLEGTILVKAGTKLPADAPLIVSYEQQKYVSRAGLKLEKALEQFFINVKEAVCLDAGLSTGGFTDCLLQKGAKRVYGVDVGWGQVHEKIRNDTRVVIMEKVNLRLLSSLPEFIDICTLDLSFISLTKVIDAVSSLLVQGGTLVTLIKPQFEAERYQVEKGGRITDPKVHEQVKEKVVNAFKERGLFLQAPIIHSPLQGAASGNSEFLGWFKKAV